MKKSDLLPVPERVPVVMKMLRGAAERREPCPDNNLITAAIGGSSPSSAAHIVSLLETMGMIEVERGQSFRVITIVDTGQRTAGVVRRPLRAMTAAERAERRKRAPFWSAARDAILMQRIADGADFEQAAPMCGCSGEMAAARFDELCVAMGPQAS